MTSKSRSWTASLRVSVRVWTCSHFPKNKTVLCSLIFGNSFYPRLYLISKHLLVPRHDFEGRLASKNFSHFVFYRLKTGNRMCDNNKVIIRAGTGRDFVLGQMNPYYPQVPGYPLP